MNEIKDILLQSTNKNIKESLLLRRAFKEIVHEKIAAVTTDMIYKKDMNVVLGVIFKFNQPVDRPYGSDGLNSHYQNTSGSFSKS